MLELTGFMSKFIYKGAVLAEADVRNALELVDDDKVPMVTNKYVT